MCVFTLILDLLARVSLPPDGSNTDLGRVLHCVLVLNASSIEHGLCVEQCQ